MESKWFLGFFICLVMALSSVSTVVAENSDLVIETENGDGAYSYEDGVLTFIQDGDYVISMAEGVATTADRMVAKGVKANITLNGIDIDSSENIGSSNHCAFMLEGAANVTLVLADGTVNSLKSGSYKAGLQVLKNVELIIEGDGELNVVGGSNGPGIGGASSNKAGKITIKGGIIRAMGGDQAAGIGTSYYGSDGMVVIEGGIVEATGGNKGAGIGGGDKDLGGTIIIKGGTIRATGGNDAADIGRGKNGSGGTIIISGGSINAQSIDAPPLNTANDPVYKTTIALDGVNSIINVTDIMIDSDVTYCIDDIFTDEDGKIYLYLPGGTSISGIIAGGNTYTGSITTSDDDSASAVFIKPPPHDTEPPPSSDASLSGLSAFGITLTPAFDSVITDYMAVVANDVTGTVITVRPSDNASSITINGSEDINGEIVLDVGNNIVTIKVTAEDGVTTRVYTVNINREAGPSKYDINIDNIKGGTSTVITEPSNKAAENETVVINIDNIDTDKKLKSITVTDTDNNNVVTTEVVAGRKYSFTMLARAVTITATWRVVVSNGEDNGGDSNKDSRDTHTLSGDPIRPPVVYPITNKNGSTLTGGKMNLSSDKAKANDTVTIVVIPDRGYENNIPIVLDKNGNLVRVIANSDGTFSFRMPDGEVSVDIRFSKIDYYDDVDENDWYDGAAWFCTAYGLMEGTGHRQFGGNQETSRAMLVTVLYRLSESNNISENIFVNIESEKWYTNAIAWAVENGIVEGYGNGEFGPDDMLTREQMVTILYRYSQLVGCDMNKINSLETFNDVSDISDWASAEMRWAVGNGLVRGMGDGLISPKTGATRAQFAAIMQRYYINFIR
ncbi:MAG TPA: S-layer homology domain-containing protein [Clostridia bacterium]|nr:S-layer homology domain-containing protein [Clostridia bacterium]